jgi:DNA-directed RNA polymerase specialized sigma24 family protein
MQRYSTTELPGVNRDELIMTLLGKSAPMLQRIASDLGHFLGYDFDDLYQMAAVAALEHFDNIRWNENPVALLGRILRCQIINKLHVRVQAVSLDVPLGDDSDTTLVDLLATPESVEHDEEKEDIRTGALYAALKRLPLETQMYVRRVNDLNAFNPVLPVEGKYAGQRPNYDRSNETVSSQAYRVLRSDKSLVSAVCQ